MPTERRVEKMKQVLQHRQPDLTVVCDNIHDPHNVSAILRTCDAVGIQTVNLLYTDEAFPEIGKKSSASAKKWIEVKKYCRPQDLLQDLKNQNFSIYATGLDLQAISIFDIDWTRPSAIIMGNEHRGVSEAALEIADQCICIPMFGMIESLNVSVATAVILYEAARQRMAKGLYPRNVPDDPWLEALLQRWQKK